MRHVEITKYRAQPMQNFIEHINVLIENKEQEMLHLQPSTHEYLWSDQAS